MVSFSLYKNVFSLDNKIIYIIVYNFIMNVFVDIDNTICKTSGNDYINSTPITENINKINNLYDQRNNIVYWTPPGHNSKRDLTSLSKKQLSYW